MKKRSAYIWHELERPDQTHVLQYLLTVRMFFANAIEMTSADHAISQDGIKIDGRMKRSCNICAGTLPIMTPKLNRTSRPKAQQEKQQSPSPQKHVSPPAYFPPTLQSIPSHTSSSTPYTYPETPFAE
jgi:hypothetical protein